MLDTLIVTLPELHGKNVILYRSYDSPVYVICTDPGFQSAKDCQLDSFFHNYYEYVFLLL